MAVLVWAMGQISNTDVDEARHWIKKWDDEEQLRTELVDATKKQDVQALNQLIARAKQTTLRDSTEYDEAVKARDELQQADLVSHCPVAWLGRLHVAINNNYRRPCMTVVACQISTHYCSGWWVLDGCRIASSKR